MRAGTGHERAHGPYRHRNRWRIVLVGATGLQSVESFESEREALKGLERARQRAGDRTIDVAITAWLKEKKTRGAKAGTIATDRYRLRGITRQDEGDRTLDGISVRVAKELYTKRSAETSPDTHLAELSLVAGLWDWCMAQGWVAENPWRMVEGTGSKRARPKDQLRVDEARRLLKAALGEESKEGLAVAMALMMGLRASEVTSRVVRDLDDRGRLLWIPDAKTPAGVRQVKVPTVLTPLLVKLTRGQDPSAPLFGSNRRGKPCDRHWLEHHALRLCAKAKIPEVRPHALRGLHATIATVNGVAVDVVARALGHETKGGAKVTRRHYIAPGAEESARGKDLHRRLTEG